MVNRILLGVLGLLAMAGVAHAETVTGPARVVDGDTLEVDGRKVRLLGIDAPEKGQTCDGVGGQGYPCGFAAAANLTAIVGNLPVTCAGDESDRYGRLVAICLVNGIDLGGYMVDRGWAVAYRKYSGRYIEQEAAAHTAKLNLWSGEFVMPWDWRRSEAEAPLAPAEPVVAVRPVRVGPPPNADPNATSLGDPNPFD